MVEALKTAAEITKQYGLGFGGFLILVTVAFLAWASGRAAGAAMGFIKDLLATSTALRSQVKKELDDSLVRIAEQRELIDEADRVIARQRSELAVAHATITQLRSTMTALEQRAANLEVELASARAAINEQARIRIAGGSHG